VPFSQSSNFIFYWRDLVEKAGYHDRDIPQDWNGFWNFWKQVQDKLQLQPQTRNIYGLGFSLSDKAGDTYFLFEQGLEAYDAQLLTPDGKLQADDPTVRQRIIECLKWYTQFYKTGYMLPDAVKWLNPDNNTSLLNREIVMTPNTSMTIPATVRKDPEVYRHKLVTRAFPNKLNGQPIRHILTIKQAVIFTDSTNQAMAKAFLSYFIQPQVLGSYLKAAGIRNQPVTRPTWQDPFWSNPNDPHIAVAVKVLSSGQTRPFPSVYHPAYSLVTQENVWGKAINEIAVDEILPEQAADKALTRIKQIFQQWQ
jgi:multiple sugar transport system substrate-binding protein